MNKYFNEIGSALAGTKAHSSFLDYVNLVETTFEIQVISVVEVKKEISSIKTSSDRSRSHFAQTFKRQRGGNCRISYKYT